MKDLKELMETVTDERIRISEEKGTFYAVVVEENGDEFDLSRSTSLNDLYDQLRNAGVAE